MKVFWRGVITGAAIMLALVLVIAALRFFHNRDKQLYEYVEHQNEIQELYEDYGNRNSDEFLDDPGVRGAADRGLERINRKRDEILHRGRSTGND
jgi:hypothetical protein